MMMKKLMILLVALTTLTVGCTNDPKPSVTAPSPPATLTPNDELSAEVQIYSAVIRRLVTRDHTFGGGRSPFKHIYVVDGIVPDAENPMRAAFQRPPEPFPPGLIAAIEEQLGDLPPMTFVEKSADARPGKRGAEVKNRGVILSLGAIQQVKAGVHVPNSLWCGGTCGQWMTYVLVEKAGRWRIIGTTGPYAIS